MAKLLKHGRKSEEKIFKIITNKRNQIMCNYKWSFIRIFYMRKRSTSTTGGRGDLSPLLFAIYLNDLEIFLNKSGCRGVEIDVKIMN